MTTSSFNPFQGSAPTPVVTGGTSSTGSPLAYEQLQQQLWGDIANVAGMPAPGTQMLGTDGKPLLDKAGNPIYAPSAPTVALTPGTTNPDFTAYLDAAAKSTGQWMPDVSVAEKYTQNGGTPLTTADINNYNNNYAPGVLASGNQIADQYNTMMAATIPAFSNILGNAAGTAGTGYTNNYVGAVNNNTAGLTNTYNNAVSSGLPGYQSDLMGNTTSGSNTYNALLNNEAVNNVNPLVSTLGSAVTGQAGNMSNAVLNPITMALPDISSAYTQAATTGLPSTAGQIENAATGTGTGYADFLANQLNSAAPSVAGGYTGTVAAGTPTTTNALNSAVSGAIPEYMNPYEDQIIGGIESAMQQNFEQNVLPSIQDRFVEAGQAASPQQMEAENRAAYLEQQAVGQQVAQALNTGYQGALNTALNTGTTGFNAAATGAGTGINTGLSLANTALSGGQSTAGQALSLGSTAAGAGTQAGLTAGTAGLSTAAGIGSTGFSAAENNANASLGQGANTAAQAMSAAQTGAGQGFNTANTAAQTGANLGFNTGTAAMSGGEASIGTGLNLGSQGYQGAVNTATGQQDIQLRTGAQMGQLGALNQSLGNADVNQLGQAGMSANQFTAANNQANYKEFTDQYNYPATMLTTAANAFNGVPSTSNTSTTAGTQFAPPNSYGPSPISTGIGATAAIASAMKAKGGSIRRAALSGQPVTLYATGGPVRRGALSLARRAA